MRPDPEFGDLITKLIKQVQIVQSKLSVYCYLFFIIKTWPATKAMVIEKWVPTDARGLVGNCQSSLLDLIKDIDNLLLSK